MVGNIYKSLFLKAKQAPAKLMWPCFQIHTGSRYTYIFASATLIYTYGS